MWLIVIIISLIVAAFLLGGNPWSILAKIVEYKELAILEKLIDYLNLSRTYGAIYGLIILGGVILLGLVALKKTKNPLPVLFFLVFAMLFVGFGIPVHIDEMGSVNKIAYKLHAEVCRPKGSDPYIKNAWAEWKGMDFRSIIYPADILLAATTTSDSYTVRFHIDCYKDNIREYSDEFEVSKVVKEPALWGETCEDFAVEVALKQYDVCKVETVLYSSDWRRLDVKKFEFTPRIA